MSTKIHATVDALGNPSGFVLTPGQASNLEGADLLLPACPAQNLIADKGYDADKRVIEVLQKAGKTIVISPKSNRSVIRAYDEELFKSRLHLGGSPPCPSLEKEG